MDAERRTALIVGASRAIGLAVADEFLKRGWGDRNGSRDAKTPLHELADTADGRLTVETLDMTIPLQIEALRDRLDGRVLDLLFVNGAITRGDVAVDEAPTETFVEVMVTNALSPMRVVALLKDLVPEGSPFGTTVKPRVDRGDKLTVQLRVVGLGVGGHLASGSWAGT